MKLSSIQFTFILQLLKQHVMYIITKVQSSAWSPSETFTTARQRRC